MHLKSIARTISAFLLAAFGLLTLFLSTSIIFDLFGIRAKEGNYVPFVVWSNFSCSLLYLFAAYGLWKKKKWTVILLGISFFVLVTAFIALKLHINAGGIHEAKTISALIFRTGITLLFMLSAYFLNQKNMKNKSIISLFLCMLLLACENNQSENKTNVTASQDEDQHTHESESLELNDGAKWKVDDSMMVYIRYMENEVNTFSNTTLPEYKILSKKLQKNVDLLTSNCTMQGQAHDELHKWLVPFIDRVDAFTSVSTEADAREQLQQIKDSVIPFNQYFE